MGTGRVLLDHWRQADLVLPSELPPVTVIGAGGIGSFTILALAKMGVADITAYDDDRIENHNVPNQLYELAQVGLTKVGAAADMVMKFSGSALKTVPERLSGHAISDVVISGVDSMKSRAEIWKRIKLNISVPLYIEARMGAEVSRIHSVKPCDPADIEWYESTLYTDAEALDAPCTARAIVYNGFAIAALIANQVKKWAKGETLHKEIIFDLKTLTMLVQ